MGYRLMHRLPKFVHGYLDRHGKPRHYLRRPGHVRIPLPGMPFSTEFMDAYAAAMSDAVPISIGIRRTKPGTVEEAVARYFGSGAFAELAPSTQGMRRAVLERLRVEHGEKRIGKLQPEHVARIIGKLRPWAQRNMMKTLRGLMTFALADGLIPTDPTVGVRLTRTKDTGGFVTWPIELIEQYRATHKLGTRARLALELLYGTMQARGDVVRLGRQHAHGGTVSMRRRKTGAPVDIPVLPELQAAIDAMPKAEHLAFLVTEHGKPFSAAGFGNWFRDMCDQAGIAKNSQRARAAQGWRDPARRARMHRSRDHGLGWVDFDQRGAAIYQSSKPQAERAASGRQAQSWNEIG